MMGFAPGINDLKSSDKYLICVRIARLLCPLLVIYSLATCLVKIVVSANTSLDMSGFLGPS